MSGAVFRESSGSTGTLRAFRVQNLGSSAFADGDSSFPVMQAFRIDQANVMATQNLKVLVYHERKITY